MRSLEALVWDAVVIDEAHGLTGHSDRAVAAAALASRARTVVLLTATPHSGDDHAFESLCGIGDLGGGFPLLTFRRTRRDVGLAISRRTTSLRVRPTLAESDMHHALETYAHRVRTERGPGADPAHLAMTVLTRRACSSADVAGSFDREDDSSCWPAMTVSAMSQMSLPLFDASADEEPDVELSAPGLDDRSEERRWLERDPPPRTTRAACRIEAPDADALSASRARAGDRVHRISRHTRAACIVSCRTSSQLMLHGGLTAHERRDNLRRFTNGAARLLLATDAASEGLNLQQRCRLVINLELPWTPLRLEQRIGRVERIGQSRRVHAVHLLPSARQKSRTLPGCWRVPTGRPTPSNQLRRPTRDAQLRAAADAEAAPPWTAAPAFNSDRHLALGRKASCHDSPTTNEPSRQRVGLSPRVH